MFVTKLKILLSSNLGPLTSLRLRIGNYAAFVKTWLHKIGAGGGKAIRKGCAADSLVKDQSVRTQLEQVLHQHGIAYIEIRRLGVKEQEV